MLTYRNGSAGLRNEGTPDDPKAASVKKLLAEIDRFVPIRLRVTLYDGTNDVSEIVVIDDKKTVEKWWNFVRGHARNPDSMPPLPSIPDYWLAFFDAEDARHVICYAGHEFSIDNQVIGDLIGTQEEDLLSWCRSLEKQLKD
jgi:hypothetical protein